MVFYEDTIEVLSRNINSFVANADLSKLILRMANFELEELSAITALSANRRNTSTLESQSDGHSDSHDGTDVQDNSTSGARSGLDAASNPTRDAPPAPSPLLKIYQILFGKTVDDEWARTEVEFCLLMASQRDRWFLNAYAQIREQSKADLNLVFDIHLSLLPPVSSLRL